MVNDSIIARRFCQKKKCGWFLRYLPLTDNNLIPYTMISFTKVAHVGDQVVVLH